MTRPDEKEEETIHVGGLSVDCAGDTVTPRYSLIVHGNTVLILNIFTLLCVGKVHGSLARAGKVRGQTPKVAPQEKAKKPTGRACKRMKYNRRFVNVVTGMGKKRGPNSQ